MSTRVRLPVSKTAMAVAVAAALATGRPGTAAVTGGSLAPALELRGPNARVRLADFKGKVLLVDFWASWCAPCAVSFPALDAIYREYRSRGVEIVAVNVDERQKDADRFLAAHPHQMLVVFDPRAKAVRAFGAPGVPSSYVIDRQGMIRYTHLGYPDGTDAAYRRELEEVLAEPER
jgi:thiol-disulfide isomerase/thioredoxin